jgi:hypothetical protein
MSGTPSARQTWWLQLLGILLGISGLVAYAVSLLLHDNSSWNDIAAFLRQILQN